MMGILLIIVGIAMTAMSLLLLLVYPWALIGIAIGVLEIIYGRKKWKDSRTTRAAFKQQAVIPDAPGAPAEAAPAPAPAEMDAASKQHDPEPKPERTFSKIETHRIAGTSYRESTIADLMVVNDDYDMTASELIDAGYEDERVYKYSETDCKVSLEPEPDNQYDPNAVKVYADGVHIGYIKKGSAAHVKKLLEEDRIASMLITITGGPYKTAYLNEDDRPRTTKGDLNFSAVLEISVK
jgi:hypothetical protein